MHGAQVPCPLQSLGHLTVWHCEPWKIGTPFESFTQMHEPVTVLQVPRWGVHVSPQLNILVHDMTLFGGGV